MEQNSENNNTNTNILNRFDEKQLIRVFNKYKNTYKSVTFTIRQINETDMVNGDIIKILNELTGVSNMDITELPEYKLFLTSLNDTHMIFVIELTFNDCEKIIAGLGTIFIEQKIIHQMGKVGHIEDVVVSNEYRGLGIGKILIQYLCEYSKLKGCYKVILNCSDENIAFYEKCGLQRKCNQMARYFT